MGAQARSAPRARQVSGPQRPPRTAYPHAHFIQVPTPKSLSAAGAQVQQHLHQWDQTIDNMLAGGRHEASELEATRTALREGVRLLPAREPEAVFLPNTPAVRRNMLICKERVRYYQDIGALEATSCRPDILHPLHVVEHKNRKPRMVLDLSRNFNDLIHSESFHMQSMQDAVALSSPGCFYGKMDVSDCFLSFPVHPDSQRFLAFELDGTHCRFKRLPFGLSSAPLWTDRFMRCIDFALRQAGSGIATIFCL